MQTIEQENKQRIIVVKNGVSEKRESGEKTAENAAKNIAGHGCETIDIVIPMFNEAENIAPIMGKIVEVLTPMFPTVNFILVDDGSTDDTEKQAGKFQESQPNARVKYVRLAKNYGQDIALKCGIDQSTSDICVTIDADFQNPPEKMPEAIEKLKEGFHIVHIVRTDYNCGPTYRKVGSQLFNKMFDALSGMKLHLTDYKVLDKKAVDKIKNFKEGIYYSAGTIELVGMKSTAIPYEFVERKYGKSKYSVGNLIHLAATGMTSLSIKPLRFSLYLGFIISAFSLVFAALLTFKAAIPGQSVSGFAILGAAVFLMGGIQLISLGIIGEYLGKTFIEAKRRPQYLIDYSWDMQV